jgi:hypothetical protein
VNMERRASVQSIRGTNQDEMPLKHKIVLGPLEKYVMYSKF